MKETLLVFLIYDSRSGSTLLSSRLNEFSDIGVSTESKFMRTLLLNKKALQQICRAREVWRMLASNERFASLGIGKEAFCTILGDQRGYNVADVAQCIVNCHGSERKAGCNVWVIKDGANGYLINQIAKELPDAKFLHILRDGRAVLNSKKKTIRPYSRYERMARDAATCARQWTRLVNHVDDFTTHNPGRCLEIHYENLIADEEREIERVRVFLDAGGTVAKNVQVRYYDQLPVRERDIHTLISKPALQERIDAWKDELDTGSLLVFQYLAREALANKHYDLYGEARLSRLLVNGAFIQELMRGYALRAGSWVSYLVKPKRLKYLLDNKLIRRKDKVFYNSSVS